jgi:hypothetical protein
VSFQNGGGTKDVQEVGVRAGPQWRGAEEKRGEETRDLRGIWDDLRVGMQVGDALKPLLA